MRPVVHTRAAAVSLALLSCILLFPPGVVRAQEARGRAVVTAASAPVREKAERNARVVETLRTGAEAAVLAEQAGWLLVRTADGKTGWVSLDQVTIGGPAPGASVPAATEQAGAPPAASPPPAATPAAVSSASSAAVEPQNGEDEDDDGGKPLTIGPLGGIVVASFTGDDASGAFSARTSYTVGLALRYEFLAVLAAHVELRYARRGAERSNTDGTTTTFRLDYADLAGMVDLRLPLKLATPIVCIGAVASYKVNAGLTDAGGTRKLDGVRSFDPGVIGGVGAVVRLGGMSMLIEGLYEAHLQSIDENDEADLRNTAVTVNLGILF